MEDYYPFPALKARVYSPDDMGAGAHPLNLQRNNSSDRARPSPIDKQRIDDNKKRHSHWQWLLLGPVAANSALFCVWKQD